MSYDEISRMSLVIRTVVRVFLVFVVFVLSQFVWREVYLAFIVPSGLEIADSGFRRMIAGFFVDFVIGWQLSFRFWTLVFLSTVISISLVPAVSAVPTVLQRKVVVTYVGAVIAASICLVTATFILQASQGETAIIR